MNKSSIHTSWLSWFIGSVLLVILLWKTGHLNFLISEDAIGIGFSVFLILTLLNAAYSQFQSFKTFDRNAHAIHAVHNLLSSSGDYKKHLKHLINGGINEEHGNTSMSHFFESIKKLITLNPDAPLTPSNLETLEAAIDEDFYVYTSNEVEQAQNLTILGMLGTFLGILWGFASIDWASVTADNAFGIVVGVISGISIALITSILGILFSLFLKKMHKRLQAKHHAIFAIVATDVQEMSRILCHAETFKDISKSIKCVS